MTGVKKFKLTKFSTLNYQLSTVQVAMRLTGSLHGL